VRFGVTFQSFAPLPTNGRTQRCPPTVSKSTRQVHGPGGLEFGLLLRGRCRLRVDDNTQKQNAEEQNGFEDAMSDLPVGYARLLGASPLSFDRLLGRFPLGKPLTQSDSRAIAVAGV